MACGEKPPFMGMVLDPRSADSKMHMAANENLLPPATSPPSQAAPPLSSRTAPPLSARPAPTPEVPPAPTLGPPPVSEPAPPVAAPVTNAAPATEPLFTIKVWQLGIVVFVVLLALLYALGIL